MTVRDALREICERLDASGIEGADVEAGWIVSHVTGIGRMELWLAGDRVLSAGELQKWRALVVERCTRVPLQHLLGTVGFLELDIEVNPQVLIPRPETEMLALAARGWWRTLGDDSFEALVAAGGRDFVGPLRSSFEWLDFGAGSGCLAIALARFGGGVGVGHGLDISEGALETAKRNAERNGVANTIRWWCGDGFDALPRDPVMGGPGFVLDLIVSNPPYIPSGEIEELQPEVRHDPILALDGGLDGLKFYRRMASEGPEWLKGGGMLLAEFGDGQGDALEAMFRRTDRWGEVRIGKDLSGKERFLMVRTRFDVS